jgi:anti-sigma regulatory factor (Ser/Thr protein kinase)
MQDDSAMPNADLLNHYTQHSLASDANAPGMARSILRQVATGMPQSVVRRAELAVSEIVTNAVRHGSDADRFIDLRLERSADQLVIWVRDEGRSTRSEVSDVGGFGLDIARTMADEFDVEFDGETAWGWTVRLAFSRPESLPRRAES